MKEKTVSCRVMTEADYEAVYALWLNTPGMGLNTADDSKEGIAKYLRRNPTSCFAAECEGKIIGAILAGHDGRRGYIYHTAVLPEYRNQGAGRQLVECAMAALEAEGISKTALVVFKKNIEGNGFWERIGFHVREDLFYRNRNIRAFERIDT